MEKYKKKLQEGADLRSNVKVCSGLEYIIGSVLTAPIVLRETECKSCGQKCFS
jgi:hypothetical protein